MYRGLKLLVYGAMSYKTTIAKATSITAPPSNTPQHLHIDVFSVLECAPFEGGESVSIGGGEVTLSL